MDACKNGLCETDLIGVIDTRQVTHDMGVINISH